MIVRRPTSARLCKHHQAVLYDIRAETSHTVGVPWAGCWCCYIVALIAIDPTAAAAAAMLPMLLVGGGV